MTHEDRIYRTLNDHLGKMVDVGGMYENNDWFCIYATGSMNYRLFDDASDVDTKLLLFPSLSQVSGVTSMPTVEHHIGDEHCTACDVREFLRIAICKTNPNYMEFFTTDYYIVNPVYEKELRELRACGDAIVRESVGRFEKSCLGMARSLLKKIESGSNEGKNLCNLLRLRDFVDKALVQKTELKEAIKASFPDMYMEMKRGTWKMSHEDAVTEAEVAVWNIEELIDSIDDDQHDHVPQKAIETWVGLMEHYMRRIS